jgi:hypothetical protein
MDGAIYRERLDFGVMSSRPIALLLDGETEEAGWVQPFAGGELWTREPLTPGATRATCPAAGDSGHRESRWTTVYSGPGLVDGGLRNLSAAISAEGERRVDFEDGERFEISREGALLRRTGPRHPDPRSLERALGAPLAIALALRGIHLMHASAITRIQQGKPAAVVAFTAPSGAGKSTFAAFAQRSPKAPGFAGSHWTRVADDILPVRLSMRAEALPHFPQLKLAAEEAWPAAAASAMPLARLIEIEHSSAIHSIGIERLAPGAACLAIARATVAAKLFDPALLAAHFTACAAAAERLPVYRLKYPSGLDRLPEVLDAVANLAASES